MFWPDFGEERISGGSLISLWAVAGIGGSVRVRRAPPRSQNWSCGAVVGSGSNVFRQLFSSRAPTPTYFRAGFRRVADRALGGPAWASVILVVMVPVIPCA